MADSLDEIADSFGEFIDSVANVSNLIGKNELAEQMRIASRKVKAIPATRMKVRVGSEKILKTLKPVKTKWDVFIEKLEKSGLLKDGSKIRKPMNRKGGII